LLSFDEKSHLASSSRRGGEARAPKISVVVKDMREELIALGEQIAEQAVHLDAAMNQLLGNLRVFDERGGWRPQGFQSCAHWLSWRVGWDLATARDRVRVAHQLAKLPKVQAAMAAGEVSYSKVRAIARVATPQTEETLLAYAEYAPAAQLEKICQKVRTVERAIEAKESGKRPHPEERYVQARGMDDGMVCVKAVLRPDEAGMLLQVIQAAAISCRESADPKRPVNRADGLMAVIQGYARGEQPDRTPVELLVTIPAAELPSAVDSAEASALQAAGRSSDLLEMTNLAELASGDCVSAETSRRLACDAGLVEVEVNQRGEPLSVGRRTRTIPAAIKRALLVRDKTCRFPGCANRLFLDGHHLQHWADGGETSLSNLALLCGHHHACLHEHGYTMEAKEDGGLVFRDGDGDVIPATGERPKFEGARVGWSAIREQNEELCLHAETAAPKWNGRPVNYRLAVNALIHMQEQAPAQMRS
jgi:Domain of unknown function (DUF222)